MKGKIVYHHAHGRGIAGDARKSGLEYQVHFDSGETRWVRADTLEISEALARPTLAAQPNRQRPDNFVERQVIEALRLGIAPEQGLDLFTVGRESELSALRTWLDTPDDPGNVIIGTYGTGKTHLLNHFRSLALESGYAVALVGMDPQETPFSAPKRVYRAIVRNLRWRDNDRVLGFRELVARGLTAGLLRDHEYFKHLRNPVGEQSWAWIEGSDGSIRPSGRDASHHDFPALYDHTTAANIYCYLLSGLGSLLCSAALKLRGLLILFDESETLYAAGGQLAVDRSVNFLDALIATSYGYPRMLKPARETNFKYSGHASHIPFLYQKPSGLKLVFAFTSDEQLEVSSRLCSLTSLSLNSLEPRDLALMLKRLIELYHTAYGQHFIDSTVARFGKLLSSSQLLNTRAMVKSAVEALDICRFGTDLLEDENG